MVKQRNGSGRTSSGTHRWAVDQVEEDTAAVEQDGDHVYEIPRWLLPPGARDGDVFNASASMNDEGSLIITVRRDEAASSAAKSSQPKRTPPPRGPAGDIVL